MFYQVDGVIQCVSRKKGWQRELCSLERYLYNDLFHFRYFSRSHISQGRIVGLLYPGYFSIFTVESRFFFLTLPQITSILARKGSLHCWGKELSEHLCGFCLQAVSHVSLVVKNLPANAGDWVTGLFPALGRSPGGGHGNPLQYSCLENPMNRGIWGRKESEMTEAT